MVLSLPIASCLLLHVYIFPLNPRPPLPSPNPILHHLSFSLSHSKLMAEDSQMTAPAGEVVVAEVPAAQEVHKVPPPKVEAAKEHRRSDLETALAAEKAAEAEEERRAAAAEGNVDGDLQEFERKALDEFRSLVQAALSNNEFSPRPPSSAAGTLTEEPKTEESTKTASGEEVKHERKPPTEEAEEEKKPDEEPPKPQEEEPAPPPKEAEDATPSPSAPEEAAEKSTAPDDDSAKTVEAIEETVVPTATSSAAEEVDTPAADGTPQTEKEQEKTFPMEEGPPAPEQVLIWGVPLLGDERSDTVLLKFLRARDFRPKEALVMIKNAVLWRREFGIEALLEEDLGIPELERVVFMRGADREGHPVCYNVYGEFQDKELHALAFADEEKRRRFLRWRIQYLERGIRGLLDFSPDGVSTMVQVTDLKNSVGPAKKELRQALDLLQDNYPEFAARQIFINVPWWYLAFYRMISPFFTQRTKSKFIFAGPSKSVETLLKYIAPEHVPVQYGGLNKEDDPDFTTADAVTEITIRPGVKQAIEIPISEVCLVVWELRVLGWDVTYCAEFVPSAKDGYTVIVQKARRLASTDEPYLKGSYQIDEPGKVILTVENTTSKRKKILCRYKNKSSTGSI